MLLSKIHKCGKQLDGGAVGYKYQGYQEHKVKHQYLAQKQNCGHQGVTQIKECGRYCINSSKRCTQEQIDNIVFPEVISPLQQGFKSGYDSLSHLYPKPMFRLARLMCLFSHHACLVQQEYDNELKWEYIRIHMQIH